MFRSVSYFILFALIGVMLSACGTRRTTTTTTPVEMLFDVRTVAVTANSTVPISIVGGVQQRLEASIAATIRPVAMPRVVMDVEILRVGKGLGVHRGRSEAIVNVRLADIENGQPFHLATFPVYSFTVDQNLADQALAEAIAGRIRYSYSLRTPSIPQPRLRPRAISTRLSTAPAENTPIVVPASTVRTIGADADPVLNSKTVIKGDKPVEPIGPASPPLSAVEEGAAVKVTINPVNRAIDNGEPCVETLEVKCGT